MLRDLCCLNTNIKDVCCKNTCLCDRMWGKGTGICILLDLLTIAKIILRKFAVFTLACVYRWVSVHLNTLFLYIYLFIMKRYDLSGRGAIATALWRYQPQYYLVIFVFTILSWQSVYEPKFMEKIPYFLWLIWYFKTIWYRFLAMLRKQL